MTTLVIGSGLIGSQVARILVERGEKPPHRAVMLMHREIATQAMANVSRGLSKARIIPIEVLARKPALASPGA